MQILQGLAVSSGVAFGEALIVDNEGVRIPNRFVSREVVEDEIEQLVASVKNLLSNLSSRIFTL